MKYWIIVYMCHVWMSGGSGMICPDSNVGDNADCQQKYEIFTTKEQAIEKYKSIPNQKWARIFYAEEYDLKFEVKLSSK